MNLWVIMKVESNSHNDRTFTLHGVFETKEEAEFILDDMGATKTKWSESIWDWYSGCYFEICEVPMGTIGDYWHDYSI